MRRNATPQEKHLWYDFLNTYPVKFRRQVTVDRYIVDFYCSAAKLVIEIDGSQHFSGEGIDNDEKRTAVLSGYGLTVLRFSNREINVEFKAVCAKIHDEVSRIIGYNPYEIK